MPTLRQDKGGKKHQNQKRRSNIVTLGDAMILYIENLKDSFKKLLELIKNFDTVVGHKININESISSLYTNYETFDEKMKETGPFLIRSEIIKYFGIDLTKELKDGVVETIKYGPKKLKGQMC